MANKYNHPEYREAVFRLSCALDIPDRVFVPIRELIGCSLGRIFWLDWLKQDAVDTEWMPTPGDHVDPEWHRIDGWPEQGDGHIYRKWSRRAALWMQWHSVDAWHVCDWLITAVADEHPWLVNVDDDGFPKKIMKCSNLERLVHEASKGLRQRNIRDIILGPEDETFVYDLGAGHTLVQLLSRAALRRRASACDTASAPVDTTRCSMSLAPGCIRFAIKTGNQRRRWKSATVLSASSAGLPTPNLPPR